MTPTWLETKVGAPPGPPPRARLTEHARSTGMVLSALANKVTNKFKAFCKTELMDRFLHSCIEYFQAFFDLKKALAEVADEAAKTKSEKRENPAAEAAASAVAEWVRIVVQVGIRHRGRRDPGSGGRQRP